MAGEAEGFNRYVKTEHSVYKYAKRHYEKLAKTREMDLSIKLNNGRDGLVLEGFANKFTVDRGSDIIKTDAWELDNFKKNPIILFNHGLDPVVGGTPIGRALDVQPTDQGLYIKVRISKSKSPLISMIRDLIEEGMLKAFSVGFEAKDRVTEEIEGKSVNVIKQAELFEVSVVGVPMNQDSTFEITGKSLLYKTPTEVKASIYHEKGGWVASAANLAISEAIKNNVSRNATLKALARRSKMQPDQVRDILAGTITPVPEKMLEAMSTVLQLDMGELMALNAGDKEAIERLKAKEQLAIKSEQSVPDFEESDMEEEELDMDAIKQKVKEKLPTLLSEGMEEAQAIAVAFAIASDGKANPDAEDFKEMLQFVSEISLDAKEMDGEDDEEEKEEKEAHAEESEEVEEAEEEKGDEPEEEEQKQVEVKEEEITEPIQTAPDENDFGNPHLEQAKQTNVLLGTIASQQQQFVKAIEELNNNIRELTDSMRQNGNNEMPMNSEEEAEEDKGSEEVIERRSLDSYRKRLENVRARIKNMS